jgi:LPXTG-motif cell wall-anchored protein
MTGTETTELRRALAEWQSGHPEGIPATGKQTKEIIWTLVGFCLLLAGLAYLVWAGSHGSHIWA